MPVPNNCCFSRVDGWMSFPLLTESIVPASMEERIPLDTRLQPWRFLVT